MSRYEHGQSYYLDTVANSGIHHRLSKLQKLELCYNITRNSDAELIVDRIVNLFAILACNVHGLRHISIIFGTEQPVLQSKLGKAVENLIKSQSNLEYLELYKFWDSSTEVSIYSALVSQSRSLTFLKILGTKDFHQLLPFLKYCTNLKTLCITPSIPPIKENSGAEYSSIQLRHIYFQHYIEPNMITSTLIPILRMSSQNLRILSLQRVNPHHLDLIARYCSNITTLSLNIAYSQLSHFGKIISNMNLRSLTLKKVLGDTNFCQKSINDLAKSIPSSLKYFGIGFKMLPITLKLFLSECQASLCGLDLYYYFNMIDDSYLQIFIQYAKENDSFRQLRFEDAPSTHLCGVFENPSKLLQHAKSIIPVITKFKFGKDPFDDDLDYSEFAFS
ncbi:2861_t:CDS:1 [Acaulospora colombiana]|uniref:2861_t:CDS:1 n=1 Tax=Acaulospora colombiana TaxID=27376 RepID=A0ACA9M7I5_9GLOM|nr:2861_t:CDS:1 [Acaulospora colombiana]